MGSLSIRSGGIKSLWNVLTDRCTVLLWIVSMLDWCVVICRMSWARGPTSVVGRRPWRIGRTLGAHVQFCILHARSTWSSIPSRLRRIGIRGLRSSSRIVAMFEARTSVHIWMATRLVRWSSAVRSAVIALRRRTPLLIRHVWLHERSTTLFLVQIPLAKEEMNITRLDSMR